MRHLKFGLMFVGLVAAEHCFARDNGLSVSRLDLATIHVIHTATEFIPPYQFTASVVLTRPVYDLSVGTWTGITPNLYSNTGTRTEEGHAWNSGLKQIPESERVTLPRILKLEFKGDLLKLTLRPNVATIESSQLKLTMRPGSTWMLWKRDLQ